MDEREEREMLREVRGIYARVTVAAVKYDISVMELIDILDAIRVKRERRAREAREEKP